MPKLKLKTTNPKYRVENGIPLPPARNASAESKYPLARMEVGSSFAFPAKEMAKIGNRAQRWGIRQKPPRQFAVRLLSPRKARIWRVK